MKKDFILPDIGEGIVECEIVEWLVAEGDSIKEDQPVCDVMTDKALVQIPAVHDGVISKLYYAKGDIAKVHGPLFEMELVADVSNSQQPAKVQQPSVASSGSNAIQANEPDHSALQNSEDFILPDIGEGIVECEIVEWLVAEGDEIQEDQPVCDVMTDKALVQIPAKYSGIVTKLYYAKGEIAQVHAPLFAMQHAGSMQTAAVRTNTNQLPTTASRADSAANNATVTATSSPSAAATGKALASPAVRRLARELNVDISQVMGSGDKGRVYKQDIQAYVDGKTVTAAQGQAKANLSADTAVTAQNRVEPIKGIKAVMARQMTDSVSSIPHFTYCEEIDLTELIALRTSLKEQYQQQGVKLTMMPFFIKALSLAIKQFPVMNSQVNADCTELTYFSQHNIGIAVDSKVGLLVPNIKDCQDKSVIEIAQQLTRLTDSAREGRVSPADLKGGTISISNIGALGGTVATPIINKPEVAIVALGKVQTLPRFNAKGEVEARQLMQISWSGDHRVIDGGTIARFTNVWKQYLEQPGAMLVALS